MTVMFGVPCRLHDLHGDDLGTAHLPPPIEPGDLVATELNGEYRVVDVIVNLAGIARHAPKLESSL